MTEQTEEIISTGKMGLLGVQHVLAMCAGTILVPLLLGSSLGLSQRDLSYLIAADFFTCGVATIIQARGIGRWIGIRLPVVMGCSSIAIVPMIVIGKIYGITAIYGAVIVSGILMFFIASVFRFLFKLFPPVVIGSVITIIGLSLILTAIKNIIVGGTNAGEADAHVSVLLATFVLVSIILINKYLHGFARMLAVLSSLIAGTIIAYFLGMVNFGAIKDPSYHWLQIVRPFYFGIPQFKASAVISLCLVSLVNMIDSVGVFLILGKMCDIRMEPKKVAAGFRAEGLAQILGGLFNAFPYITFSQNVGLVALTRVKNRYITVVAGVVLVCLGFVPKIAVLVTLIPKPVLGGAMLALFGMVAATGIQILSDVDFKNANNLLIIGVAIGISLAISSMPDFFKNMPDWGKIFFSNGIVVGSVVAIVLNLLFNGVKENTTTTAAYD